MDYFLFIFFSVYTGSTANRQAHSHRVYHRIVGGIVSSSPRSVHSIHRLTWHQQHRGRGSSTKLPSPPCCPWRVQIEGKRCAPCVACDRRMRMHQRGKTHVAILGVLIQTYADMLQKAVARNTETHTGAVARLIPPKQSRRQHAPEASLRNVRSNQP